MEYDDPRQLYEISEWTYLDEVFPDSQGTTSNQNQGLPTVKMNPRWKNNNTKSAKKTCLLPVVVNFGSASLMPDDDDKDYDQQVTSNGEKELERVLLNTTTTTTKTKAVPKMIMTHSRDHHVLAERRRREKMTRHFISLSALLPYLKRMDKGSILGEAVKYVKELQERIKVLEDHNNYARNAMQMSTAEMDVQGSSVSCSGDNNGQIYRNNEGKEGQLPDIQARLCDNNNTHLLRIQCERRQAVLVKILSALERLHMSITTVDAIPFGDKNFIVTIIAQMEKEVSIGSHNIVRYLSSIIKSV